MTSSAPPSLPLADCAPAAPDGPTRTMTKHEGSRKHDRRIRIRLQAINLPPSAVSVGFQSFHTRRGLVGWSFSSINEVSRDYDAGISYPVMGPWLGGAE